MVNSVKRIGNNNVLRYLSLKIQIFVLGDFCLFPIFVCNLVNYYYILNLILIFILLDCYFIPEI